MQWRHQVVSDLPIIVNHVSSCVYEIPGLLSLLVLACMLIYEGRKEGTYLFDQT